MVLAIVAWNYWAPLIVAISTDTLAPERIGERVREISAPSVALLDDQIATQDAKRRLRAYIANGDPADIEPLLNTYAALSEFEQQSPRKIRIAKYANSQARHYFFASYLAFAVLLVLHRSLDRQSDSTLTAHSFAISFGVLFFIFLNWSNWWRNTPWGQSDRTLFSYAHFDISPLGFAMQELQILGMMILCGYVAALLIDYAPAIPCPDSSGPVELSKFTKREFEIWQIRSVLLAIAFLPWTIFYWRIVTSVGETRYFPSAISMHVIWAILWLLASAPAWRAFHAWQEFSVTSSAEKSADDMKKIQMLEPVSRSIFVGSAVASTISFAYPIFQSLF